MNALFNPNLVCRCLNASVSWTIWPIMWKFCVPHPKNLSKEEKKSQKTWPPIINHLPFCRLSQWQIIMNLGGYIDLCTSYGCVKFGISQPLGGAIANKQVSKSVSLAVISGEWLTIHHLMQVLQPNNFASISIMARHLGFFFFFF